MAEILLKLVLNTNQYTGYDIHEKILFDDLPNWSFKLLIFVIYENGVI